MNSVEQFMMSGSATDINATEEPNPSERSDRPDRSQTQTHWQGQGQGQALTPARFGPTALSPPRGHFTAKVPIIPTVPVVPDFVALIDGGRGQTGPPGAALTGVRGFGLDGPLGSLGGLDLQAELQLGVLVAARAQVGAEEGSGGQEEGPQGRGGEAATVGRLRLPEESRGRGYLGANSGLVPAFGPLGDRAGSGPPVPGGPGGLAVVGDGVAAAAAAAAVQPVGWRDSFADLDCRTFSLYRRRRREGGESMSE